jgi:hypothetical protein
MPNYKVEVEAVTRKVYTVKDAKTSAQAIESARQRYEMDAPIDLVSEETLVTDITAEKIVPE